MPSYFSFSDPLNSGIDFYRADDFVLADASITITSNVVVVADIFLSQIYPNPLSGDVIVANTIVSKTVHAESSITPSSSLTALVGKLIFASASLSSSVNLFTIGRIFLTTIHINILNNTNITAKAVKFSSSIVSDASLIRNLLLLDNKPLTNQSRTFAVNANPKFIENVNWQGNASRYYKNTAASQGAKRTFNIDWSFIPNDPAFTVDLGASRNFLKQIAEDSDVHVLTIINQDISGTAPYTEDDIDVFITSYSETLIRRDLPNDSYYFSCNMVLEEA